MKELRLEIAGKAWVGLANVVVAVVVYAGLGDAITAADSARIQNDRCSKVPQAHDYLAATVDCLKKLVERKGGGLCGQLTTQMLKISDETFWNLTKNPFMTCDHSNSPGGCWQNDNIFQHLASVSVSRLLEIFGMRKAASSAISIPVAGAVVFGVFSEDEV
ncbi:uncharacterized protein BDV17DRAFT_14661 [Aspergillus undulatus]|uniref:uncharacterized protein n=1 Tax=Aspergillus undulatus TaxID=1810928 RepID=UPI003CCD64DC